MTAADTEASAQGLPPEELLEATRELLRRAVLTLGAIPDPDLRFRVGPKTAWPAHVQDMRDAYNSAPAKWKVFEPTRQDLDQFVDVLSWLNWYRRQGSRAEETAKLFTSWCLGAPMWMLQARVTTNRRHPASPQTVYNRFASMLKTVVKQYAAAIRTHAVDSLDGLDQKRPSSRYGSETDTTDLKDLPKSPKHWMTADGKPLPFDHPEAVEARRRDAESAKAKRRANRRRRRPKRKKSR